MKLKEILGDYVDNLQPASYSNFSANFRGKFIVLRTFVGKWKGLALLPIIHPHHRKLNNTFFELPANILEAKFKSIIVLLISSFMRLQTQLQPKSESLLDKFWNANIEVKSQLWIFER